MRNGTGRLEAKRRAGASGQEKEKKKHPHTEFSFGKTYEKTGVARPSGWECVCDPPVPHTLGVAVNLAPYFTAHMVAWSRARPSVSPSLNCPVAHNETEG